MLESEGIVHEELRQSGLAHLPGTWIDTGDAVQGSILLVDTDMEFDSFSDALENYGSIFIRHLAPVQYEDWSHRLPGRHSLPELSSSIACREVCKQGKSFSVQSRILGSGKLPYRKVVLNETLSQALEEATEHHHGLSFPGAGGFPFCALRP